MLSPKEFVVRWGKEDAPLMRFPKKAVEALTLSEGDKLLLAQAGLPEDAAPFLTFEAPHSGPLPTVGEQWDQPKALAAYRIIGADGSGNPSAVGADHQGEGVVFDHEKRFARILM